VPHKDAIDEFIGNTIVHLNNGQGLVFATLDKAFNKVVGAARFMAATSAHKRVEIGFTFIGQSYPRIKINTEAKLLMLTHAVETLGLDRVQFLTDYLNQASRIAVLRIGVTLAGILKSHMQMADGRIRDSVILSITSAEWVGVKKILIDKLK
jgi:RimJ/RimL family protein N-acetyltransferase|tara:strand:- start:4352 stop:4807 length:456 start_codon:yes stop_codon:yes gene_type:complete